MTDNQQSGVEFTARNLERLIRIDENSKHTREKIDGLHEIVSGHAERLRKVENQQTWLTAKVTTFATAFVLISKKAVDTLFN